MLNHLKIRINNKYIIFYTIFAMFYHKQFKSPYTKRK